MSGHSHWAGIKHKKGLEDVKRGKVFSKLGKMISVAVRDQGGDPDTNPRLRVAIEKAHEENMPNENIERAIKRGAGEIEGVKFEQIVLEIVAPDGVAILAETITDNKNRTLSEIKRILSEHNAKLASEGSVKWMFSQKGVASLNSAGRDKEGLELTAIDAGAEDIAWDEDLLTIYTAPENIEILKQNLEQKNLPAESSEIAWVPQNPVQIDLGQREKLEKLLEALDDYEDVQEIYSNLK